MKLVVVVERTESGYSAFAPDLPGCIATRADVEAAIQEAIAFHLEGSSGTT